MPKLEYIIKSKVWRYPGEGGWYFVTLGKKESAQIKWLEGIQKVGHGFGPVTASVKNLVWKTTLFPSKDGQYLLAFKAVVRKKENIQIGDKVIVNLILESPI